MSGIPVFRLRDFTPSSDWFEPWVAMPVAGRLVEVEYESGYRSIAWHNRRLWRNLDGSFRNEGVACWRGVAEIT